MLAALSVLAAVAAAGARAPGARAEEKGPPPGFDPVTVERVDGDLAALVADTKRALAARDWDGAAVRLQAIADAAAGPEGRDRVVETSVPGPGREPLFVGFPEHVRAWFARLPPAALRAYRRAVDAKARAVLADATARRDEAALERGIARWLFATAGEDAAVFLGDVYLERGEALGALATYDLVGRHLGPEARARVAARREAAARALERRAERCGAAASGGAREVPDVAALLAAAAGRVPIPLTRPGEAPLASNVFAEPVEVPGGGLAIVRPGRVALLRPGGASAGAGAFAVGPAPAPERELRTLPPGGEPRGGAPVFGPLRLGAAAEGPILCAAIDHPRLLDGDLGPIPGAAPLEIRDPAAALVPVPGRRSRGAVAPTSFDLFAFDVERGDRLLWTTAEVGRFPGEEAWLASVEWTAVPLVAAGAVFGAATTRGGEPEIHLAAFDAGAPGRLRWRRFICARGFGVVELREEAPPIQPAIALSGGTLVVDTGIGLIAGVEAFRGEVRWLARCARPRAEPVRVLRRGGGVRWVGGTVVQGGAEPWPPLVIAAGGAAIFAPATSGFWPGVVAADEGAALFAVDPVDGRVLWRAATEEPLRPIACVGPALLAAGADEVALFDRRTGKRTGEPLALPRALAGRPAIFEAPASPTVTALALLPLRGAILAVTVERREGSAEPRLVPAGVLALAHIDRGDLIPLGGKGAAYVDGDSVAFLVPAGGERHPPPDVAAIVDIYAPGAEPSEIEAALEALRVRAAAACPGPRGDLAAAVEGGAGTIVPVAPGDDEDPAYAIEPGREGEAAVARARFRTRAGRPRIAVSIDAAGRMTVEAARAAE